MRSVLVRRLTEADVPKMAEIHAEAFSRQGHSAEWIRYNAQAFPRMRYYVAESAGSLCGFVLWTEKSGSLWPNHWPTAACRNISRAWRAIVRNRSNLRV
jgi:hypothetical protein